MANIYRQSQLFRAALLRRERRAATELAAVYTRLFRAVTRELDQLVARIVEEGTPGLLIREQQLRHLLAQIEAQATKFTAIAVSRISREQAREIEHGAEDAVNLLRRAYAGAPAGLTLSFSQLPIGVIEALVGNLGDGSPLRLLLASFGSEAAREISALFINAVGAGRSVRAIAREMRDLAQQPLTRTLLVSRTEVLRAYRQGSISTYQANKDVVKGWRWLSAQSERTCIACWILDGSVHDSNEDFSSHPNCLTAEAVVVAPSATAYTSRWFDGEVIEIQTLNGYTLTITPNHPILTSAGWVAAQFLREGGDVISGGDAQRVAAVISPNDYNTPARIEQIWKSLAAKSQMLRRTVPASSEDFHGDGGFDGEVDVVWANSFLRYSLDAPLFEPSGHQPFFIRRAYDSGLSGSSSGNSRADWLLPASNGSLSSQHNAAIFFGAAQGCHQTIGLGLSAQFDRLTNQPATNNSARSIEALSEGGFRFSSEIGSGDFINRDWNERAIIPQPNSVFSQNAVDYFEGDAEAASKLLARLTGLVTSDKILKIRRFPFSGQVYNLQTKSGWYSANNIITHNCRCTPVPITKSWAELGIAGMPELAPVQTGESKFLMMPAESQRRILGNAGYKAWKAGAVTLEDFVGVRRSAEWGDTHYHRSLREILGPDAERYYGKTDQPAQAAAA